MFVSIRSEITLPTPIGVNCALSKENTIRALGLVILLINIFITSRLIIEASSTITASVAISPLKQARWIVCAERCVASERTFEAFPVGVKRV